MEPEDPLERLLTDKYRKDPELPPRDPAEEMAVPGIFHGAKKVPVLGSGKVGDPALDGLLEVAQSADDSEMMKQTMEDFEDFEDFEAQEEMGAKEAIESQKTRRTLPGFPSPHEMSVEPVAGPRKFLHARQPGGLGRGSFGPGREATDSEKFGRRPGTDAESDPKRARALALTHADYDRESERQQQVAERLDVRAQGDQWDIDLLPPAGDMLQQQMTEEENKIAQTKKTKKKSKAPKKKSKASKGPKKPKKKKSKKPKKKKSKKPKKKKSKKET
jgi:hypothetical protein